MTALRIGAEVAGSAAVLAGAAGVALHFSPFDARLTVLAAALAPYLMLGAVLGALLFAGLDALLPHRYVSPGRTAAGTGIWSRYPLTGTVEFDGFVLNQLGATAEIPGAGPVTVFALHPVPPVYGIDVWADELERLRGIVERAPADRPVVVGGDFNATTDHAQFRRWLTGRLGDAAEQAGAGFLRTYPADKAYPPLVGIDHILLAGGRAHEVRTVALPGADHRAVVARVRIGT